jgi:hypothetical protein
LEIDKLEDCSPLALAGQNFRRILKVHLARLLEYQNIYWKKRCTIRWTKFGDENTIFFTPLLLKDIEEIPSLP